MNEIQRLIHEMCPDGVPMVALGEVCEIKNGKDYKHLSPGNIPVWGTGGIMTYVDQYAYNGPSVLLPRKGSIDKVYYSEGPVWTVDTLFYTIINESIINPKYLYAVISMQDLRALDTSKGNRPSLTQTVLNKIQIPLPPLPIQQRIVEILDKFTSLVSSLDSEIALRQKQYEYYRNKLLSFEEGEEGVEWKKLIDIVSEDCSVSYGIVQPGDDTPNGIPVVRPVDMTDNIVFNKGLKRTQKENSDAYSRTILKGGEILVCVRGTTGIVSIASQGLKGCNVTRGIVPLSFKNDIETKFVFHTFKTHFIQDAIENKTNGTGLRQINIKDLKEILFPIPPLPKQLSIVRTLDTFESLLTNLKKERELRQKQYEYYREKLLTFA